ncbi:MAG: HAMP domain-containing protein [Syntrophales bacterium]|nr:HAMP domain-containing protein [Syntrophales bacterium]
MIRKGMKFTISRKLAVGYLGMACLMIMGSSYAIDRLQDLNSLANTIINQDFVVLETAKQMMDTLLALENAEKKYLILKDPSIADIFWTRSQELGNQLNILGHNTSQLVASSAFKMIPQKREYEELFKQEMTLIGEKREEEALKLSTTDGKRLMDSLASSVRALQKRAEKNIDSGMKEINIRSVGASRITVFVTVVSLIVGLIMAILITLNISRPLRRLEKATKFVAEGQFDMQLRINRDDEIGHLAEAFDTMTQRLKILEALHLDASPLTRLPGNLAIEQEIEKRLKKGASFSLCHIDLDNFKPFADAYGYAWGSEVIKETAVILVEVMENEGNVGSFIGHIGGDDFVLIADPVGARLMCGKIVDQFEKRIRVFYSEEDRHRGFIIAKDRQGQLRNFPLISITISIVTGNGTIYRNALDMAKMAAEVKEYGKSLPGSNCVTKEEMDVECS